MRTVRTVLFLVVAAVASSPAWSDATVALWQPTTFDRGGGSGLDLVVPITVSPAAGVVSMDFVFDYDPVVLKPASVHRSALTNAFTISADLGTPGVATISLRGSTALSGTGDVAYVLFRVLGSPGEVSTLRWVSALLNAGAIPAQTQDGRVPVITAPSIVGLPDETRATGGSHAEVPITAQPATDAVAFDMRIEFNPHVVTALGVQKTARTEAMTLTANLGTPGVVLISLFGTQPIPAGADPVARITFDVVGPTGDRTPLNLKRGDIDDVASVLDDGLFAVCDGTDADGDTFTGCAGDCDNTDPGIHPGAAEICNGRDDDCDGAVDNGIAPPAGVPFLTVQGGTGGSDLTWSAAASATVYDVVGGDLAELSASHGDFSLATHACLGSRLAGNTTNDLLAPATGNGTWYLVRAVNCGGAGSYDSGAPSQQGSRDAEIGLSAGACP